jgi:hypothetical protein
MNFGRIGQQKQIILRGLAVGFGYRFSPDFTRSCEDQIFYLCFQTLILSGLNPRAIIHFLQLDTHGYGV